MDSHTELCVCQWVQSRTVVRVWLPTSVFTLGAKSDSVACCWLVVSSCLRRYGARGYAAAPSVTSARLGARAGVEGFRAVARAVAGDGDAGPFSSRAWLVCGFGRLLVFRWDVLLFMQVIRFVHLRGFEFKSCESDVEARATAPFRYPENEMAAEFWPAAAKCADVS